MRGFVLTLSCLAVFWVGPGCGSEPANLFLGEELPVVDMHLHTGTWDLIPPTMQEFLSSRFPFPLNLFPEGAVDDILSTKGILDQLDDARISNGVLFAVYAPETVGVAPNQLVAERVQESGGRFFGFGSTPLADYPEFAEERLAELEKAMVDNDFIGIKLAHPHALTALDDHAHWGIYELAGRLGVPVYLHIGTTPSPGALNDEQAIDPQFIRGAIELFPQTTFILGHVGYDFIEKTTGNLEGCLDLAATHDNVLLETSALGSSGSDPEGTNLPKVLEAIRERGLVDRLIYGSDGPQRPGFVRDYLARTVRAMETAGYTVEEARSVLSGNFARVFNVDVEPIAED